MQIVFFNVKTQNQVPVEVDDNLCSNMDDIRLLIGGDVYRPVSTVPDEIRKLNNLRVSFEDGEFENLRSTFTYDKKEDVPENFVAIFSEHIDKIIQEKYKDFYESIKDNFEQVYRTIAAHFLTYSFMVKRFNDILEESKSKITNKSFAKDFAARLKIILDPNTLEGKSLKAIAESLDQVKRYMTVDDRRHAFQDRLMAGVGMIHKSLIDIVPDDTSFAETKISFTDGEYVEKFKAIKSIFETSYKYYESLITDIDAVVKQVSEVCEDKFTAYLKCMKGLVNRFIGDTDTFMREIQKNESDKDKIDAATKEYATCVSDYYSNLNSLFAGYDTDTREVETEREKLFVSVWESSCYFKENGSSDRFVELARMLYRSYADLFGELMSEEEKAKYKAQA